MRASSSSGFTFRMTWLDIRAVASIIRLLAFLRFSLVLLEKHA
jgi:hypothetical protein